MPKQKAPINMLPRSKALNTQQIAVKAMREKQWTFFIASHGR